ncbi:MAG: germination protein YpeB, partial [Acutalibacteraceae bacterium]|nr:germination protein YpeB [Acutalibacteraceae bacterium]
MQAGTAASALAELPIKHESLETVSQFLSQVSDYSLVLARNVVRGGSISDEERKNLATLSKVAQNLSNSLDEAKTMYNGAENWADNIENALKGSEKVGEIENSITEAEESLSDYPTLIYDGPFSDHILDKESELLQNSKEISREEAREIAAATVGLDSDKLSNNPDEEGKIRAFVFGFENGVIAVTKQGGYVLYFRKNREIQSSEPDYEKAVRLAKKYVESLNMGNFKTSYYFADEGMCVINFAYVQGDTVCYPDLIKVGVAMDTGEIVFYEAAGYI